MFQLNKQEKDVFLKLARSSDGQILRDYISKLIDEIVNVDNLSMDVVKNAQTTKSILKNQLLNNLVEVVVEPEEPETYE